jgi:3'-phosphoadenosine 5'-phosphosulfate sulfotransferase (PAPS reductase)/FAD synthetase
LVVYNREKVAFECAVCDSAVAVSMPYPHEYMEAVYIVRTEPKVKRAREVIREHSTENMAATLSGKDSTAAADLTISTGVAVDIVIATHVANRRMPQKVVEELIAAAEALGARRIVIHDEPWDIHTSLFSVLSRLYGYNTIVTGLRRRENRGHAHVIEYHRVGPDKKIKLINPIIDWSATEVWSYIYHHRLPIVTPYYNISLPNTSLQDIVF